MGAIQTADSTLGPTPPAARRAVAATVLSRTAAESMSELGRWAGLRSRPPWLVMSQLFFAMGWLRASAEKMVSPDWWSGDTIRAFLVEHDTVTVAWFRPFVDLAVIGQVQLYVVGIVLAQLACGLLLLSHRLLPLALVVAMTMNLAFVAIGAVNPSTFYLIGQGAIALWLVGNRRPTASLSTGLRWATGLAVAVTFINLPLVGTVDPRTVIEDPAAMIATLGGLTALGCELTRRAVMSSTLPEGH